MKIAYYHASKFGNGARVAEEFKRQSTDLGAKVDVYHIRKVNPKDLPHADLYVFSSPGRLGKPIKAMRRFLNRLSLPTGTRYAILTTEIALRPDKNTGATPSEVEQARTQRVRPIMDEILQGTGLAKVAEDKIQVLEIKGPLEEGWEPKVKEFVQRVLAVA